MTISANYPAIRPSLILDFANTKQLDPRITFSRPTTATYYDGKTTAVAEQNLLTNSQTFATTWTLSSVGVTENAVAAPDGTSTAASVVPVAASASHIQAKSMGSITGVYTYSLYAKANGYNYLQMFWNSGSDFANFYLSGNGTVSLSSGAIASITSVGNGWYRCSITSTVSAYTYVYFAAVATGAEARAASYTANGTSGIYVWGAQLEQRSTVTAYTPTTTAPITNYIPALQTAAAGVPRFDHDPVTGESKGLLIEEQRTNLLTYSADFSNAAWVKINAAVTADTIVAPDGTLTADKWVANSGIASGGSAECYQYVATAAGTYTYSLYLKHAGFSLVTLAVRDHSSSANYARVTVSLTNGLISSAAEVGGTFTNPNATVTQVGNYWYKVSLTFTSGSATAIRCRLWQQEGTGDGYSGIYIWGAQLEAGSYPTSYIPTVASQVTRSADSASMTGSNVVSDGASSWYIEANSFGVNATGTRRLLNTTANVGSYFFALTSVGSSSFTVLMQAGGSSNTSTSVSGVSLNNTFKVGGAFSQNDFATSINGAAIVTASGGSLPQGNTVINFGGPTNQLNGWFKRIAYYPKRLSNVELQSLTS